jgi:hypothetical protein
MAEGNSVKRSTTRFQMHQILKLREQEVIFLPFIMPLFLSHVFQQRFELVERITAHIWFVPVKFFHLSATTFYKN